MILLLYCKIPAGKKFAGYELLTEFLTENILFLQEKVRGAGEESAKELLQEKYLQFSWGWCPYREIFLLPEDVKGVEKYLLQEKSLQVSLGWSPCREVKPDL